MENSLTGLGRRPLTFYLTDYLTTALSVFFALVFALTIGRVRTVVFGVSVDRGALMAGLFLVASSGPYCVVRLLHRRRSTVLQWLRVFYVQLYYFLFFQECIRLSNALFNGRSLDALFVRLDSMVFGFQPALEFHRMLPQNPFVTELFFFGYSFYFLLFSLGIWVLFFRGRREEALRFLSMVTLTFYIMYVFYVFFPVMGPKYYFDSLRTSWYDNFDGFLFTGAMKAAFQNMDLYGAAFPSSHAAIATLSLLCNFKFRGSPAWALVPPTLLLYGSTVYIYAHYAVDTLAGIVVGISFYFLLPTVIDRLNVATARIDPLIRRTLFGRSDRSAKLTDG